MFRTKCSALAVGVAMFLSAALVGAGPAEADDANCSACKFFVDFADQGAAMGLNEQEIAERILMQCQYMSVYGNVCQRMAEEWLPFVMTANSQNVPHGETCTRLRYCPEP